MVELEKVEHGINPVCFEQFIRPNAGLVLTRRSAIELRCSMLPWMER